MPQNTTQQTSTSNVVSPKKPQMGGLLNTQDREEAWTGGKLNLTWTSFDHAASKIPIATQIHLNTSKVVAVAMIKRTKRLYTKETTKFKHDGDLDFFCKMFEKHLQKHGLNTIALNLSAYICWCDCPMLVGGYHQGLHKHKR